MRRRLIPVNVVMASLLFALLSLETDSSFPKTAVMESGKAIYQQHCTSCHGDNGEGFTSQSASLSKSKWVMGRSSHLIKFMIDSAETPVKGKSFHQTISPFTGLNNDQLSEVITYVRNSFGNTAKPVTPADVRKQRATKKS